MLKIRRLWTALCVLAISASVHAEKGNADGVDAEKTPYVVMISLDGFRHDYVEKHQAKRIGEIAKNGVRAEKMIPAYPSNTFPNHISLITGLLPVNHGIVNNAFYDKSRP